jgi:transformation/transcription domain-associated protein
MEYLTLKKEIMDEVGLKIIPPDILTRVGTFFFPRPSFELLLQYMIRTMEGPSELWRMRKQFALQIASTSFMTYVFCLTSRIPSRFHLSRATGQIAMSELLPGTNLLRFISCI